MLPAQFAFPRYDSSCISNVPLSIAEKYGVSQQRRLPHDQVVVDARACRHGQRARQHQRQRGALAPRRDGGDRHDTDRDGNLAGEP